MLNARLADRAQQIRSDFADAVLEGLAKSKKSIPCSYLYDDKGSELFEQITQTKEYYPSRTELALLERHVPDIAKLAGPEVLLIEFGSGSSRKTRTLIEGLVNLAAYIPIDISDGALQEAKLKLKKHYPALNVVPLHADFNQPMDLPSTVAGQSRLGFFPGSTIGNFTREEASSFLRRAADLLGPGNGLVIGVDLKKDHDVLEAAYNDADGVTADFNLNLLDRINRELDGNFDRANFAHHAKYNPNQGRIEIHIESLEEQTVSVLGETYELAESELIHTENSHKYSLAEFEALAEMSGWAPEEAWVDDKGLFSVHFLRAV